MNFNFSKPQHELYELVGYLAREHFAPRASVHDRERTLPLDNLADLHKHGLLSLTIARERGGLGSGVMGIDPTLYLLAIEQTARVDLSTAHCLHVHLHATHLIDQVMSGAARDALLRPVVEHGALIGAVGSEPGRSARGINSFNTVAQPLQGGYVVNGRKNYGTLADVASTMIVSVTLKGEQPNEGHLGLAIPRGSSGFAVVPDTWHPIGMRSAVSPDLIFDSCFVPSEAAVGSPGTYPRERWQARHYLALSAQYLGACEGVFDRLTDYLPRRGTARDQYTQLRLGQARVQIDSVRWLIYRAASLWTQGDLQQAELFSLVAKHHATCNAVEVMDKAAQIAGSHALMDEEPLSRMIRDLRVHTLHSNVDKTAATIGKFHLGQSFDTTDRL
jgi:alkylation response protein AidB-like acyl-CoA dehydrogenase